MVCPAFLETDHTKMTKASASTLNTGEIVLSAIKKLMRNTGWTARTIIKFIKMEYKVADPKLNRKVSRALKRGVKLGLLQMERGRYRLNELSRLVRPVSAREIRMRQRRAQRLAEIEANSAAVAELAAEQAAANASAAANRAASNVTAAAKRAVSSDAATCATAKAGLRAEIAVLEASRRCLIAPQILEEIKSPHDFVAQIINSPPIEPPQFHTSQDNLGPESDSPVEVMTGYSKRNSI
ncbi:hypothetical protein evm_009013 [Chilo suppressalis]|nr:hypothetical protein evm_009013 [Chilo suppressalis]